MLAEQVANLSRRAVAVVGEHLEHHRHAARTVALVDDLLVRDSGKLAGAPLDGLLQRVVRHVGGLGGDDRGAQTGVTSLVASAFSRGGGQLADDLREELAALGVELALLVLDRAPLVMT